MKSLLVIFLSLFLSHQINLTAQTYHPLIQTGKINCAREIQEDLFAIYKIPEGKALIDSIVKDGSLRIIVKKTSVSEQFGAYWDPDTRTICLAVAPKKNNESVTGALLFELHNAQVTSKIDQLDELASQRKVNRASYVESMEYLEYINSLNAANIAEKGIQMGVLDKEARLPTYSSFKEHFHMQKISGHSDHFSRNYDRLSQRYY